MANDLFGLACERASNAFLFSAFYECLEGRRNPDDSIVIGAQRAREYVELANKLGTVLTKKGEDYSFDIRELDAYLELSEALAVNQGHRVSLLDNGAFNRETSFLAQVLEDIENKRGLAGERKQKACDLILRLSNYFSKRFAERAQAVQEQDYD